MLRFRLFGIPYEITPYFWIGSAILSGNLINDKENGILLLVTWLLCVLVSIVVHEQGHALAGRHFGLQPHVVLYQFGGLTYLPGGTLTRGQHIVVSLAGPAAGFLLYGVVLAACYALAATGQGDFLFAPTRAGLVAREAANNLLWINWVWTLFNLLPILPLDGGQVMRDVLGPGRLQISRIIGAVCAVACCAWAILSGRYFTAFFMGFLAYANLRGDTRSLPGGVQQG